MNQQSFINQVVRSKLGLCGHENSDLDKFHTTGMPAADADLFPILYVIHVEIIKRLKVIFANKMLICANLEHFSNPIARHVSNDKYLLRIEYVNHALKSYYLMVMQRHDNANIQITYTVPIPYSGTADDGSPMGSSHTDFSKQFDLSDPNSVNKISEALITYCRMTLDGRTPPEV